MAYGPLPPVPLSVTKMTDTFSLAQCLIRSVSKHGSMVDHNLAAYLIIGAICLNLAQGPCWWLARHLKIGSMPPLLALCLHATGRHCCCAQPTAMRLLPPAGIVAWAALRLRHATIHACRAAVCILCNRDVASPSPWEPSTCPRQTKRHPQLASPHGWSTMERRHEPQRLGCWP